MRPGKPRAVNDEASESRSLHTFLTFNNGIGQGILGAGLEVLYLIDLPLFRSLIDRYQLDLNSRHPDGQTILMMAAKANRLDIVEYLLGGNVQASHHPCHDRDNLGQTPLMIAAAHGAHQLVKCLLDSGEALPNAKNNDGQTALMIAALASKRFNIKTLMESEKSELDFESKDGQTLLMIASRKGWGDIVNELLKTAIGQSQLNATDDQGQTALLYALKEGKQNGSWKLAFGCLLVAIRLLQDEHTDIGIVDVDGNSTVSILQEWGMDIKDDWSRAKILEYAKVWYEENEPEQWKHLQLDWTRVLTPTKTRVRDRVRSFIGV
ncbi:ankyrin repeat-containing domain protein [Cladorrhinum sp. PSN259]|nr:ankyrin repeat-containing domain protein [Cladorrhinum sp. PSN259]